MKSWHITSFIIDILSEVFSPWLIQLAEVFLDLINSFKWWLDLSPCRLGEDIQYDFIIVSFNYIVYYKMLLLDLGCLIKYIYSPSLLFLRFFFSASLFWSRILPALVAGGAVMTKLQTLWNIPESGNYSFILTLYATLSYDLLLTSRFRALFISWLRYGLNFLDPAFFAATLYSRRTFSRF